MADLEKRVTKLEKRRHSGLVGLAVIMRPGETPDEAIRRTIAEAGDMPRQGRMIVVPAKNIASPQGAAA